MGVLSWLMGSILSYSLLPTQQRMKHCFYKMLGEYSEPSFFFFHQVLHIPSHGCVGVVTLLYLFVVLGSIVVLEPFHILVVSSLLFSILLCTLLLFNPWRLCLTLVGGGGAQFNFVIFLSLSMLLNLKKFSKEKICFLDYVL